MISNQDIELQRRILGIAVSQYPVAATFAQEILTTVPSAWFTDRASRIYHQCLLTQSSPDSFTVAKAVQESGLIALNELGPVLAGVSYNEERTPTKVQMRTMVGQIRSAYIRHRIECMADTLKTAATADTPDTGMAMIESEIADIRATSQAGNVTFAPVKDAVAKLWNEIVDVQERITDGRETSVLSTGIESLDRQLFAGGFTPGQMIFVGARPGQGKSSFLVTCAVNMAREGRKVGIITLEMRDTEIAGIMVQHCGNVSLRPVFSRVMNNGESTAWMQGAGVVAALPIWMDSSTSMNIDQVCARIVHMVHAIGCEIVFVDYTQRIKRRPNASTFDELSLISERLTDQAKHLNIPIVGLVQLNRDADGMPGIEHFKGTGQFEQDAHIAILLYRPDALKRDDEFHYPGMEPMSLVVAKQRRGVTGVVPATFHRSIQRIS